ncbi:glycosyl hydrolase family 32 [Confluentibacter flavum]|uniref:Glycosyl hydrolase family 32 n=2 Tax=Confluentibacter flavum TaxID=1909700 RepID=A0A2N3HKA4_9FLAO|nr:glycosyl hydrolase family 32 [Confluentibacter flavum]
MYNNKLRYKIQYLVLHLLFIGFFANAQSLSGGIEYNEQYRPQIHFTPKKAWMNDPNGLIYFNKTYHMFFQHYPDSTVWGPMHWGHAESKDLVHWVEKPIALYPDNLGYIYSGSAVIDKKNTSGFGKLGKTPLVSIFTHSNPILRKEGQDNYQYQSLAYSLDSGNTWTKYNGNPVLNNPGIKDFRDPKVSWFEQGRKWIMTLATKDRVTFYSSINLKEWHKESEFGNDLGAHGGVWECPDLISFVVNGKKIWVLIVSINPGGPNGGSATQYFVGDFDGHQFSTFDSKTRWVDYGTDNYAGVTFFNTKKRKLFIGWMSNWQYANKVPTTSWRSAMTTTRELSLKKINNEYLLASKPVKEYEQLNLAHSSFKNIDLTDDFDLTKKIKTSIDRSRIQLTSDYLKSFSIILSNDLCEQLILGYNESQNEFYIDRTKSGKIDFEKGFSKRITSPRLVNNNKVDLTLIIDDSSVELFTDDGLTVMTALCFPQKKYNNLKLKSNSNFLINNLDYWSLKSIWNNN